MSLALALAAWLAAASAQDLPQAATAAKRSVGAVVLLANAPDHKADADLKAALMDQTEWETFGRHLIARRLKKAQAVDRSELIKNATGPDRYRTVAALVTFNSDGRPRTITRDSRVEATISRTGCVRDARVTRNIPYLDLPAVTAVTQWTFEPTRIDDTPVPTIMTVTVNFRLQ